MSITLMNHGHSSGVTNLQQVALRLDYVLLPMQRRAAGFAFLSPLCGYHGDAVIGDVGTQKRGGVPSL